MKKIICDTNIWYGLGNGNIVKPENVLLVATWINILEIGFSHPKLKDKLNIEECKRAAKAILDFSDEIIEMDPFCYTTVRLSPDFKININSIRDILVDISNNGLPDSHTYQDKINYYDSFMKMKADYAESINIEKAKIRERELKTSELKTKFKESDDSQIDEHAVGLLRDINEYLESEQNMQLEFSDQTDIDSTLEKIKTDFECFILTRQKFMKKLILTKSMTMQPNDFFDLLNLLYIDKTKLFWTKENRWKAAIKEADMGNYLFEHIADLV